MFNENNMRNMNNMRNNMNNMNNMRNNKTDDDYIKEIRAKMRSNILSSDVRNYLNQLDKIAVLDRPIQANFNGSCPVFYPEKLLLNKKSSYFGNYFGNKNNDRIMNLKSLLFDSIKDSFNKFQQKVQELIKEAKEAQNNGDELKYVIYRDEIQLEFQKYEYLLKTFCGCIFTQEQCNAKMIGGIKSKKSKKSKKSRKSKKSKKSRKNRTRSVYK